MRVQFWSSKQPEKLGPEIGTVTINYFDGVQVSWQSETVDGTIFISLKETPQIILQIEDRVNVWESYFDPEHPYGDVIYKRPEGPAKEENWEISDLTERPQQKA